MKKQIAVLLTLCIFNSFAEIPAPSKEELAQEVAHCYVANQRGSTELFKSGEAEKMIDVIAELIGIDNINKTIQIANRIQVSNAIGGDGLVHMDIKKYCRPLDEILIDK